MNWKTGIAVIATAMLVAALYIPLSRPTGWETTPAFAAPASPGRLVAAGGLVEPATEARLLEATVVGRIVAMNVEEGERVGRGTVIAEVENDDLKAQVARAEAALAARTSELARLKAGAREQEIAEARAAVREAEALAAVARSNYERRRVLGDKQIVSEEAVDQALADRDAAEARRALLTERLNLLVAPPRPEDVVIAQANVDAAQATLSENRAQLEKTIIRSPVDGIVLKLYRRLGETVTNLPPTPIASVGDISRLRVRADVDEADVGQIAVGQAVWVTADAFPDMRFSGTIARIGAQLGPKNFRNDRPDERIDTKVLEVLIDLEPGASLPIGLPVDVRVERRTNGPLLSRTEGLSNPGIDFTKLNGTIER